jgi:hypothetical protein
MKDTKYLKRISKISLLIAITAMLFMLIVITSCSHDPVGSTGTSVSGYTMAVKANPSELRANGDDTALIVVEVWDENGNYVDGELVRYATTLGSLENETSTTSDGVAVNVYESSEEDGMAIVTVAVENIVTKVEIVQYYTSR